MTCIKILTDKKGFTLIELMMVVVVIGILLLVLVPKYTGVKDTAKTAGVSSNMHVVHAQVQAIIENYDDDEGEDLEEKLALKVEKLVNPVTQESDEADKYYSYSVSRDANSAVVYFDDAKDDIRQNNFPDEIEEFRGCVLVSAYSVSNDYLAVRLTPFDADGLPGESIIVTNE